MRVLGLGGRDMVFGAIGVGWGGGSGKFGRVGEKVFPDGCVGEGTIWVTDCGFSWGDTAMGAFLIAIDIGIGDDPARKLIGRGERIGVDDRSIGIQAKEFPASAIVIAGPTGIEDMGEAEEAFARCS